MANHFDQRQLVRSGYINSQAQLIHSFDKFFKLQWYNFVKGKNYFLLTDKKSLARQHSSCWKDWKAGDELTRPHKGRNDQWKTDSI